MKGKLILFMIMVISIHSYPFLRKLAETKESCEKKGKGFQEAKSAQCKTGNTIFEVSKKADCKKGEWTALKDGICSATANPALTEKQCNGKPIYSEKVPASPAKCIVGTTEVSSATADENTCKNAVYWNNAKCSKEEISVENCDKTKINWNAEEGTCKYGSLTFSSVSNSTECNSITTTLEGDDGSKKCTINNYSNCASDSQFYNAESSECSISIGTGTCESIAWETTKEASCEAGTQKITSINSKDECDSLKSTISLSTASCSISGVSETDCKKGATYTKEQIEIPAKCTLGSIAIIDTEKLESKSACETALVWQTGTCSNVQVTNEEDCVADFTYTDATEAQCVEKEDDGSSKSNSSFLVFKLVLVLAVSLLF